MSRTDKTKPWQIRVAEHHPIEIHHHERGVCDLPDDPREEVVGKRWTMCHWGEDSSFWHGCCHGPGENSSWRRIRRRKERAEAKQQLHRELIAEPVTGKPRPKKNYALFCGGKPGRQHQGQMTRKNWQASSWMKECHASSWSPSYWHCWHQEECVKCGKILSYSVGDRCPVRKAAGGDR